MGVTKTTLEELFAPESDHVERLERDRVARHIAKGIVQNELPKRQKQILYLYYEKHLTMSEIAKTLGIHISTVSRTHRRACDTIRNKLQAYHLY